MDTRVDTTSYAINFLSQFMHRPHKSHFQAALRVTRHLKGTNGHRLTFKKKVSRV